MLKKMQQHRLSRLVPVLLFCIVSLLQFSTSTGLMNQAYAEPSGLTAKRVAPPSVDPVTIKGVRFEVIHWGKERGFSQNGGYIAAIDPDSGQELWTLKVYDINYDTEMESDVQDVFIECMSKTFFSGKLKITDEKGRSYIVDPETRIVQLDD
ncbi:hypothetical protein [Motiliproteus sp. MSK22-1]|uniref:hypothetical protein n=1 Tax=Motiliproteus sp. MSK22-1 TaxID=1897630 RepID=UPI0018E9B0A3|nr:hypothetical protein [Motiliproteus sp. MSK22-1]